MLDIKVDWAINLLETYRITSIEAVIVRRDMMIPLENEWLPPSQNQFN